MIPVEGHKNLYRDEKSGAIINCDITGYNMYNPGFDNLTDTDGDGFGDEVIDGSKNSGRADSKVPASTSGEFVDYQFTADNLTEFTGFQIKIVFNGTNEAEAPKFKDLRVIALA